MGKAESNGSLKRALRLSGAVLSAVAGKDSRCGAGGRADY